MGRKKKRAHSDHVIRIFCYYCDRTFQTEQMLLMHQREKHLRCPTCHKRMLSIPSMAVHSSQMHNAPIAKVPNAMPGRDDVRIDVLGMKGIPDSYYASLDPAPANKSQRTAPPATAAAAPQRYAAYPVQPQYPYQNGAATYSAAAYSPHSYLQNVYPPAAYPQPAYPHTGYPSQSTYPPNPYAQAGYPPGPYAQPYTPAPAPYSQPYHHQQQAHPPASSHYRPPVHNPRPAPAQPAAAAPRVQQGPQMPHGVPTQKAEGDGEKKTDDVKIVFDRLDCSMEELRAKLPRYSKPS